MFELPTSIQIDGQSYNIRNKGDYRTIIDCFSALQDVELSKTERVYASLIIFYEDVNDIEDIALLFGDNITEAVEKMYSFFNCNQPQEDTLTSHYNLVDWDKDSMIISSAVNQVAGKEIRSEEYIHWWTFMGYYIAVKDSLLNTVICIRYKMAKGKSLEKHERRFVAENPQYFQIDVRSTEEKENDMYIKNIWNVS